MLIFWHIQLICHTWYIFGAVQGQVYPGAGIQGSDLCYCECWSQHILQENKTVKLAQTKFSLKIYRQKVFGV